MSVFLTFDKAPWTPMGRYVAGDKPKYPLSSPSAWNPIESLTLPDGVFYVTLGCPDKMDCIVCCLEVPSGVVVGYDRRARGIIRPRRAGMGVVMTLPPKPDMGDVIMAAEDWYTVVSRVPDEDFGEIREWRGGDYAPREFMFTVDPRGDEEGLYRLFFEAGVSYVKPRGTRRLVEILRPNKGLIRLLVNRGYRVFKDWSDVEVYE